LPTSQVTYQQFQTLRDALPEAKQLFLSSDRKTRSPSLWMLMGGSQFEGCQAHLGSSGFGI
jgi:hypothetical protein